MPGEDAAEAAQEQQEAPPPPKEDCGVKGQVRTRIGLGCCVCSMAAKVISIFTPTCRNT